LAIRISLADDHPIFRAGLRTVIAAAGDIDIIAEADDGEAALVQIEQLRPDIAVLDMDMPKRDAFGVAAELARRRIAIPVVFLTLHQTEPLVRRAFDAGVRGYVVKDGAVSEIVDCIRAVHAGHMYVSPQLAAVLITRRQRVTSLEAEKPGLGALTATERRVLALIADARSSKAIAEELFISVRTVERHRANICEKLDLHGVNALTKFAIANRSEL